MVRLRRARGEPQAEPDLLDDIRSTARPLRGAADLSPLMQRIGGARCALLGEASHGTREYYLWRAEISKRLITEAGFSLIAVEGDWPDCYRLNRYVKGLPGAGESARDVLHAFDRWPTWMWANEEIVELAEWLRRHNDGLPRESRVGFYGLDVYSLWNSLYEILGYLRKKDGKALEAARRAFRCFEPYGEDVQEYARATRFVPESCEDEAVELLRAALSRAGGAGDDPEDRFAFEQNALVLKNAEAYYRAMVQSGPESWNVRDRHMDETLARLLEFFGPKSRAVVWEHNTHIGDARYTDMADDGMVNIGQLARERFGEDGVVLVGFGSHRGTVIAGDEWEAPMERMTVPPAREGSWEDLLHEACGGDRLLLFDRPPNTEAWFDRRGHRAIGVVYHPEYERYGNYVPTVLPRRYDAFLYLDRTEALRPLHFPAKVDGEAPGTYPSGV